MEYMINAEWQKINLGRLALALSATSLIENLLYHPWWVLKTREQVELVNANTSVLKNSYRLASNIWRNEGLKALYRGFWPGTFGSIPSGYLYLIVYHKIKHDLSLNMYPEIRMAAPFIAGITAEVASIGIFVPTDVITQRMQLRNTAGLNCFQVTSDLLQKEGLYGIYRGTTLTAIKLGIGSGVWWLAYEHIKPFINRIFGERKSSGVLAGFIGGLLSTLVTNPLDVVKTRIQTQVVLDGKEVPYNGVIEGFKKIWAKEGWSGLNRGLIPKLISQGPLSAVWAVIYEIVLKYSIIQD